MGKEVGVNAFVLLTEIGIGVIMASSIAVLLVEKLKRKK